jgi:hypothetical protein
LTPCECRRFTVIRSATPNDLDFLFDILTRMSKLAGYDKVGLRVDKEWSYQFGRRMISGSDSAVFIAEIGGKPIASIGLKLIPWSFDASQSIVIEEWWFIRPEHRGNLSLINAMIELAEWWTEQRGATALWMAALGNNQKGMQAFYERRNFIFTHTFFIKEIKNG